MNIHCSHMSITFLPFFCWKSFFSEVSIIWIEKQVLNKLALSRSLMWLKSSTLSRPSGCSPRFNEQRKSFSSTRKRHHECRNRKADILRDGKWKTCQQANKALEVLKRELQLEHFWSKQLQKPDQRRDCQASWQKVEDKSLLGWLFLWRVQALDF